MIQTNETSKPWHKYPLVWMMLSIPFSAVIMGVVMLWLAIDTDDGLVADDYYKQGMAINDIISLDIKATALQLNATLKFSSGGDVINVEFDKGLLEKYPDTLQLNFQHATRANSDVNVQLIHGIDAAYIGHLKQNISEGIWYFEISEQSRADAEWKLNARNYVRAQNVIKLKSSE